MSGVIGATSERALFFFLFVQSLFLAMELFGLFVF